MLVATRRYGSLMTWQCVAKLVSAEKVNLLGRNTSGFGPPEWKDVGAEIGANWGTPTLALYHLELEPLSKTRFMMSVGLLVSLDSGYR